jgi:hypothetical protein
MMEKSLRLVAVAAEPGRCVGVGAEVGVVVVRDLAGRVSVAQVGVGSAGVEVEDARERIADVAFVALEAFAYSGGVVGAESVVREVGLVDAWTCVALTSAGLVVEGAGLAGDGPAEPCAG